MSLFTDRVLHTINEYVDERQTIERQQVYAAKLPDLTKHYTTDGGNTTGGCVFLLREESYMVHMAFAWLWLRTNVYLYQ